VRLGAAANDNARYAVLNAVSSRTYAGTLAKTK